MVPHTCAQMFALVDTVEDYPKFLPWCAKSEVLLRNGDILQARIYMDYMKIRQSFSTHNDNNAPHEIRMKLLDGPFTALNGIWRFDALGESACKIHFTLDYEFSNAVIGKIIGPVFNIISGSLMSSFIKEAKKRYG